MSEGSPYRMLPNMNSSDVVIIPPYCFCPWSGVFNFEYCQLLHHLIFLNVSHIMSPDLSPLWVHAAARPISSLLIIRLTSNLQHLHIIQIGIQVERVRLLPNSSVYNQHMKSSSMLQKEPNMMPTEYVPLRAPTGIAMLGLLVCEEILGRM